MNLMATLQFLPNIEVKLWDNQIPVQFFDFINQYEIVLDGIFGFSFTGPITPKFSPIFDFLKQTKFPIFSIDVPSGWDIEKGNIFGSFEPLANISLGCVKPCMEAFKGVHYFAGHYMPEALLEEFKVKNPVYSDRNQLFTEI